MGETSEATDLESIIHGIDQAIEVRGKHTLMIRMQRDWPAIRAALERSSREAELVEALRETRKALLPRSAEEAECE